MPFLVAVSAAVSQQDQEIIGGVGAVLLMLGLILGSLWGKR